MLAEQNNLIINTHIGDITINKELIDKTALKIAEISIENKITKFYSKKINDTFVFYFELDTKRKPINIIKKNRIIKYIGYKISENIGISRPTVIFILKK